VLEEVNRTLGMDGTIVLIPTEREGTFRASQWMGFSEEGRIDDFDARVAELELDWPPEGVEAHRFLLVNKHAERTPFVERVHDTLGLPYFVCVPVMVENALSALLVSGRVKEAGSVYPPLDQADVDTFEAISSLVSRFVEIRRIGVLEETDRLKTRFFANVSHELRTPITLTLGPLEGVLTGRFGPVSDAVREQGEMMRRNQQRLLGLVQELLNVARLEAGQMPLRASPLADVNAFVDDRLGPFRAAAQQRDLALETTFDARLRGRSDVVVDREKLHELLANLLSNALKFTRVGRIEVSTELREDRLRLSVSDTGVGIKADELQHVFDRFRQAEGSVSREMAGTGLGLAWVKEIAELHGGSVSAHSDYGKGTTFIVELPLGTEHLDPNTVVEFEEEDLPELGDGYRTYILSGGEGDGERVEELNEEAQARFDTLKETILYVEDNADLRLYLRDLLQPDYNVFLACDGRDGLGKLHRFRPDLVIVDQMMPRMSGGELLAEIRGDAELHATPVVVLTARAGIDARVESLEAGADDYLAKPFDVGELGARVKNLLRMRAQERELREANRVLEARVEEQLAALARKGEGKRIMPAAVADQLISRSPAMQEVLEVTARIAESASTVLISGETGTGKELLARTIHMRSPVSEGPFVPVHCAALPAGLIESELFGHEKGAFTGATARRQGRFELANGGTLFLDEVGEIGPEAQVKLLRVLQERQFERVGGNETITVQVRIVAATNRDLGQLVREGRFREDLFYRLNVIPVNLPPLRQRREDIPLLVVHFLDRYRRRMGRPQMTVSPASLSLLSTYDWPGNVREIQNVMERIVVTVAEDVVEPPHLPAEIRAARWAGPANETGREDGEGFASLEENERAHILRALEESNGVIRGEHGAASLLGLPESTLRYRMKKLGLKRSR
jgi:DNA-binding NtrC family response regulator/signal transduction histidine kinase